MSPMTDYERVQVEAMCVSLSECIPYLQTALHSDQPWRRETAQGVYDRLRVALDFGERLAGLK